MLKLISVQPFGGTGVPIQIWLSVSSWTRVQYYGVSRDFRTNFHSLKVHCGEHV
jgi:hypothetical protein